MFDTIIVRPIMAALSVMAEAFSSIGVPYAWGFAIIAFTLAIKLVTWPLAAKQVKASKKMQDMQPQLQALQKKYANDKERLAQEQMKLYKEGGANPLGGCLPSLLQLPIWIGLYNALYKLANEGLLTGGFLWLKDLTFPNPQVGTSWLSPNGANWQGWVGTIGYLLLPILTVITQIITQKMMSPTSPSSDPTQKSMNSMMMIMPFMFGFFALTLPSGLSIYWVTTNVFTMIQQYVLTGLPSKSTPLAQEVKTVTEPVKPETVEVTEKPAVKRMPRQTPKKRAQNARNRK